MRRDLTIRTGGLAGTSDFRVLAPIKKGFVPSLDAVTYKTRVKRVLRTLHAGRTGGFEYELARVLSDAVERVGCIHSVGIAVLEPEGKVLLTVTFDGAWESYVRIIWQKVARLLDLIFCNTEGYVLGYENSYEKWGAWLKQAQSEASFFYATPGLTVDDTRYLKMEERVYRREAGESAELRVMQIRIPATEEIAQQSIFAIDGMAGIDPTNAGFSKPLSDEVAGRPAFRQGVRSVVGLYRLADVYPPNTADGVILHRAALELLPEFNRMLHDGTTYQLGLKRALQRFPEAMLWMLEGLPEPPPDVRRQLPVPLPDDPPLQDPGNVQGGILENYPDTDQGCLLLLQFASPAGLAALLKALPVTSQADSLQPGRIATNIAFTVEGLRAAGLSDNEVRELPEEFVQGMERRAGLLGDLRINHPRRWRLPALNWNEGVNARDIGEDDPQPRIDLSAVHAVVQVRMQAPKSVSGMTPRAQLMAAMEKLVAAHCDVKPLSLQWTQRQRNAAGEFEEHFGFIDSNSDPVLSKSKAGVLFPNQIHLGEILCGYPNLADKWTPLTDAPERVQALLQDGSFLVIRKLRQDIAALEKSLSNAVTETAAAGHTLTSDELKARMMGRWPGGNAKAGEPLVDPKPNGNDFHFDNDPHGARCPFHAHIRRANPRNTDPAEGSRPPRIVRRGMSYGAPLNRKADDVQSLKEGLDQERGLIFMAYNASIGEQFEVVQRWLSGGNSSASYSGQSDPLSGFAESGRLRYFRFEHEGQTIRMALDGSDKLHDEPHPFVRLEWGAYLFAPSRRALAGLQQRAADAQTHARPVIWSAAAGQLEIARLRETETRLGPTEAITAWKSALEDPDAATDFTSASIWAAIREHHGGVLRTPYGILVADRKMVKQVLTSTSLSVNGYLPRMRQSFGEIYLGLDAGADYERDSQACNEALLALDAQVTFERARESTTVALKALIDEAIGYATIDNESSWDLTLDVRELLDPLLADFCEEWFGLSPDGHYFNRSGYRWDWKPGQPPNYPGHFLAPSRYIFQPHPGPEVKSIGEAHGDAARKAMADFLTRFGRTITAPITRAVLDSPPGNASLAFAARTIVGAVIGFVPTVDGNIRRILNEWLRDGTLWSLRARLGGTRAADFTDACNRLRDAFVPAMQLRAIPEMIWRTATVPHTLGQGPHQVAVEPDDIVVVGQISATQQNLEQGSPDLYRAFGGNRKATSHPTHACPAADPALAVMLGFFSALVESTFALRVGPGPLTLAADGRLPPPPDTGPDQAIPAALPAADALFLDQSSGTLLTEAHAFQIKNANILRSLTTRRMVAIGDSWLHRQILWYDLLTALQNHHGYDFRTFASGGKLLAQMASDDELKPVKKYIRDTMANPPKAFLIGGGGNDVVYEGPTTKDPSPLFNMLVKSPKPGEEPLIKAEVDKFIDGELAGHYKKILDAVRSVTNIPILIHAYDHPIPDGRNILGISGPWLSPIFTKAGYNMPAFPHSNPDLILATKVMRCLINRLNAMVAGFASDAQKIYPVNLTGTLAAHFGAPENYTEDWNNELHPVAGSAVQGNEGGFNLLAKVVAAKLDSILTP
jgi:deferrochelatase/peroxidase EfeB